MNKFIKTWLGRRTVENYRENDNGKLVSFNTTDAFDLENLTQLLQLGKVTIMPGETYDNEHYLYIEIDMR